ncbi:hypothetical protein ASZ90_009287 [hydrocarbon metagenome]|uniref:Uncharacterized protein n=1 Tax=hydrocarbon metagenome TaxID=938273 RepID=A0A0W8FJ76_9ZZZZ
MLPSPPGAAPIDLSGHYALECGAKAPPVAEDMFNIGGR